MQECSARPENVTAAIEPPMTRGQRRLTMISSALAFFVSYILTAGPAAFIADKFELPMIGFIIKMLYAPLVLIVKLRIPLLAPVIEAWVNLFR